MAGAQSLRAHHQATESKGGCGSCRTMSASACSMRAASDIKDLYLAVVLA